MSDEEYKNVERALGILEGTVRSLMDQWARQDSHATASRAAVYAKLELLAGQVDRVANDAENIQQDVAEMRNDIDEQIMPTVNKIRAEWERKLGSRTTLGIIWGGITASSIVIGYTVDKLIQYFRH